MSSRRHQIGVRRTVLFVVEGDTEFAFCLFLKRRASRGRNLQVHVENAHGGSPDKIVERARRLVRQSAYDQVVIVFDDDKKLTATGEQTIRSLKAKDFRLSPCVEGFFLQLMGKPVPKDSMACKRAFHEYGLNERDKLDAHSYDRLFPATEFDSLLSNPKFAGLWKLMTEGSL